MIALAFMLQGMYRAFIPTKQPLLVTRQKDGRYVADKAP